MDRDRGLQHCESLMTHLLGDIGKGSRQSSSDRIASTPSNLIFVPYSVLRKRCVNDHKFVHCVCARFYWNYLGSLNGFTREAH